MQPLTACARLQAKKRPLVQLRTYPRVAEVYDAASRRYRPNPPSAQPGGSSDSDPDPSEQPAEDSYEAGGGYSDSEPGPDPSSSDSDGDQRYGDMPADGAAFMNMDMNRLLWVSEDGREGHFLHCAEPSGGRRSWRHIFVALRFLRFQDGDVLTGWCSNPHCSDRHEDGAIAEGCDELPYNKTWWGGSLCQCCSSMAAGMGGEDELRLMFAHHSNVSAALAEGHFTRDIRVLQPRHTVKAVKAGASFDRWGVVNDKGRCMTCHGAGVCMHTESQPPPSRVTVEEWLQKLGKDFDFEAGCRKWTCISREQLPEEIEDDPHLLQIYNGERPNQAARDP